MLDSARLVIVVPGYGLAVAQGASTNFASCMICLTREVWTCGSRFTRSPGRMPAT